MSLFIGVDIGGTNIVCGLTDFEGNILAKVKESTDSYLGSEQVIQKVARTILELINNNDVSKEDIQAIGVGTPGFINPVRGVVVLAGNLQWENVKLAERLQTILDLPVFIDNDVRMYVYGEAMKGAAVGYNHILGITLGTGIAAAVINQGQLYYGGDYMAGEIGHIRMEGVDYTCGCGMKGCLETIASGTGLIKQVLDRRRQGQDSILNQWFTDENIHEMTAFDVSRAYDAGDKMAVEIMIYTGKLLGKGLSYAVTLFSPDIIVIGGGVAMAGERLLGPMREQLQDALYSGYWNKLTISTALMNDEAGIVGNALNAKNKLLNGGLYSGSNIIHTAAQ